VEVLGECAEQQGEVGAFEAVEFGFGEREDFFGEGVGLWLVVGFGWVGDGLGGTQILRLRRRMTTNGGRFVLW